MGATGRTGKARRAHGALLQGISDAGHGFRHPQPGIPSFIRPPQPPIRHRLHPECLRVG